MITRLCRLVFVCGIFLSAYEATGAEPVSYRQAEGVEYLSSPLDEIRVDAYRQLLKEKLFTSPGDCGVFVMIPTRFPEWAVAASTERGKKHRGPTFWLSLTSATSNLYESHFESEPISADVRVNELRIQIDKRFALAIQSAWRAILSKDPLPSEDATSVILDGYSAEVSVRMRDGKVIARTTSNPKDPPAAELVGLGHELREYCAVSATERSHKRRAIIDKLTRLTERFAANTENGSSPRIPEKEPNGKQVSDTSNVTPVRTLALVSSATEARLGSTIDDFRSDWGLPIREETLVRTARLVWRWSDETNQLLSKGIFEAEVSFLDGIACEIVLRSKQQITKANLVNFGKALVPSFQTSDLARLKSRSDGSKTYALRDGGYIMAWPNEKPAVMVMRDPLFLQNRQLFDQEAAKVRPPTSNH